MLGGGRNMSLIEYIRYNLGNSRVFVSFPSHILLTCASPLLSSSCAYADGDSDGSHKQRLSESCTVQHNVKKCVSIAPEIPLDLPTDVKSVMSVVREALNVRSERCKKLGLNRKRKLFSDKSEIETSLLKAKDVAGMLYSKHQFLVGTVLAHMLDTFVLVQDDADMALFAPPGSQQEEFASTRFVWFERVSANSSTGDAEEVKKTTYESVGQLRSSLIDRFANDLDVVQKARISSLRVYAKLFGVNASETKSSLFSAVAEVIVRKVRSRGAAACML